eukprot:15378-Heterococcus_DN1.PRE.3
MYSALGCDSCCTASRLSRAIDPTRCWALDAAAHGQVPHSTEIVRTLRRSESGAQLYNAMSAASARGIKSSCPTVARTRKYYLLLHPTAAAGAHLGHVNKWTTPALSSRPT